MDTNTDVDKINTLDLKRMLHTDNVFLFIPNIIDYVRALMVALFAYFAAQGSYEIASACYVLNMVLDEVDGNIARYLGQTSLYGMLLDIFVDEAAILCLCVNLSTIYPQYILLFQAYTAFDVMGQWSNYMFASMYKNNKFTTTDDPILHLYFNNKWLTNLWVYGNHLFLLMLYVCHYTYGPMVSMFGVSIGVWQLLAYLSAPWSLSRLAIMVYLLCTSLKNIGNYDMLKRSSTMPLNGVIRNGVIRNDVIRNDVISNGVTVNSEVCHCNSNGVISNNIILNGGTNNDLTLNGRTRIKNGISRNVTTLNGSSCHCDGGIREETLCNNLVYTGAMSNSNTKMRRINWS